LFVLVHLPSLSIMESRPSNGEGCFSGWAGILSCLIKCFENPFCDCIFKKWEDRLLLWRKI
jgi:hypothetical protein